VYGIALSVEACLRAGTTVDVAWVVSTDDFAGRDPADAVGITPGGGRLGSLLSGALDGQLAEMAAPGIGAGRLVDLHVGEVDALVVGLPRGGDVRCLLVPAAELPAELWELLLGRAAVCLITDLDGEDVVGTRLFTSDTVADAGEAATELFRRGVSGTSIRDDAAITVLCPVARMVIVGSGPIVDALGQAAAPLGWQVQTVTDVGTATGLIAGLASLDKLVVAAHDIEVAGRVLAAALDSDVGYIGALGSPRMQQTRADWLAYRGITDLARIHGPAGLDIGADTPAKVAISILAEAVAAEAGRRLVVVG
jgi:xanthine dehydrogenase accessory factor